MMIKKLAFGKCPVCHHQIFFSNKEVLGGKHSCEKICPNCGSSLKHSKVKIILTFTAMLFPTVIINYTYSVELRLLTLLFTAIVILLVWFIFGYEEYSNK